MSTVLHGYLSLRRLVVQRTKLIDQTQEKLLELLEDLTTGTVEETKAFMVVCVDTIQMYPMDDQLTPVFIYERLCNIIFPEEADTGEFFMTLEKDPNQEDFLQVTSIADHVSCISECIFHSLFLPRVACLAIPIAALTPISGP